MGAYNYLTRLCERHGQTVRELAQILKYPVSTILLLEGNINGLKCVCPEIYDNLVGCIHQRDNRTAEEYGMDMVASWLIEDCVRIRLQQAGCSITSNGADSNRVLLSSKDVSAAADFTVTLNNGTKRPMELVCDYTGFWMRSGKLHLRDDKYSDLVHNKTVLLGIDIINQKFFLIDFAKVKKDLEIKKIQNHPVWNKPAVEIELKNCQSTIITGTYNWQKIKDAVICL